MWSATWFLRYKLGARVVILNDPHHRSWNDVLLAAGDAQLKSTIHESLIPLNLAFGPWASGEWWTQLRETWDRYLAEGDMTDDLFSSLYVALSKDWGIEDRSAIMPSV